MFYPNANPQTQIPKRKSMSLCCVAAVKLESGFLSTTYWRGDWGIGGSRPGGTFSGILTNHTYAILGSSHMAVTAGQQYTVRARVRGQLDADESYGNGILRVVFYNNLGNSILYNDVGTFALGSNLTYAQIGTTVIRKMNSRNREKPFGSGAGAITPQQATSRTPNGAKITRKAKAFANAKDKLTQVRT